MRLAQPIKLILNQVQIFNQKISLQCRFSKQFTYLLQSLGFYLPSLGAGAAFAPPGAGMAKFFYFLQFILNDGGLSDAVCLSSMYHQCPLEITRSYIYKR